MVVEVFIAEGDGDNALGDEGVQAVLDPIGVAVIGEAGRHLIKKRQTLLDPAQQQAAGIGSDRTAVKISHHTAAQDYPTLIFLSPGGLMLVDLGDLQAVRAWEMGVIRPL